MRWLILIAVASGLLKIVIAVAVNSIEPVLDEPFYLQIGQRLAHGREFGTLFRPPLYPFFLAAVFKLGGGPMAVRIVQALLSTATIPLFYRLTRMTFGARCALVATVLFAFDPVLITFTHLFWGETIFILLTLATLNLWFSHLEFRVHWVWAVVGLLFGVSALMRPQVVTYLPFIFAFILIEQRAAGQLTKATWTRSIMPFMLLTACMFLAITPWTIHNYRETGTLILIDSNGPFNLLVGSAKESAFIAKDNHWSKHWGSVDDLRYNQALDRDYAEGLKQANRMFVDRVASDPGRFVRKCMWEAAHLWTVDSFLLRHLRNGWYRRYPPGWIIPLVTIVTVPFSMFLMLPGLIGLVLARRSPLRSLTLLLVVNYTLLFGMVYALSRYAVPLRPFLAMGAAWLVLNRRVIGSLKLQSVKVVVCIFIALFLVAAWSIDVPLVWDLVTTGGESFRYKRFDDKLPPGGEYPPTESSSLYNLGNPTLESVQL